jgi:hypothetical protein
MANRPSCGEHASKGHSSPPPIGSARTFSCVHSLQKAQNTAECIKISIPAKAQTPIVAGSTFIDSPRIIANARTNTARIWGRINLSLVPPLSFGVATNVAFKPSTAEIKACVKIGQLPKASRIPTIGIRVSRPMGSEANGFDAVTITNHMTTTSGAACRR